MYSFQKPRSRESFEENFQFFAGLSRRSRKRFFCSSADTCRKNFRMTTPIAREVAFDIADVLVALLPDALGHQLLRDLLFCQELGMNPDNEGLFVVTTVENPDPPPFRQTLQA